MKNKKVICSVLSLALILSVSLPGTLAASIDTTGTDSKISVDTTNTTETNLTIYKEEIKNIDSCSTEDDISLYDDQDTFIVDSSMTNSESIQVDSENQIDTNTPNSEIDDTDISVNSESVCSCYTQENVHLEGCSFDKQSLFEQLMACKKLDELFAIIDSLSNDELMNLTDKEVTEIEEKILALEENSLPTVVTEEFVNESVISKIIYPAINFDNVAPFGAPVVG